MKNIKKYNDFEYTNENYYIPAAEGVPHLKGVDFKIKYPHNEYTIGEKVQVSIYASHYPGKKGIISPPDKLGKKLDTVKIDFDDGKSDYIPITHINRI